MYRVYYARLHLIKLYDILPSEYYEFSWTNLVSDSVNYIYVPRDATPLLAVHYTRGAMFIGRDAHNLKKYRPDCTYTRYLQNLKIKIVSVLRYYCTVEQ